MSWIFVCPGQGSQSAGMGLSLYETCGASKRVFEQVDDALGEKLSTLIFEGPDETLTLTKNAQPALMAVSVAAYAFLQQEFGHDFIEKAKYVSGHSLGEYSALTIAGTFDVGQCAKLLRLRGEAMQRAVGVGEGAMAAILGLDLDVVQSIAAQAAQGEVCQAANDNSPGQVVISGSKGAVERAIDLAKAQGAKRAMLLPVSAPFHCALMQNAADEMHEALAHANMQNPRKPVISNVLASSTDDVEQIRSLLVSQVTGSVRWRESMAWAGQNGISHSLEIGAGKVLSGLNKRIVPEMSTFNFGQIADLGAIKEILGA